MPRSCIKRCGLLIPRCAANPLQRIRQLTHRLIASRAILLQTLPHDPLQLNRHCCVPPLKRRRLQRENRRHDLRSIFASERLPPAHGLVQCHAEAEDVAARVDLFTSDLFWRHIGHSSDDRSRCGQ